MSTNVEDFTGIFSAADQSKERGDNGYIQHDINMHSPDISAVDLEYTAEKNKMSRESTEERQLIPAYLTKMEEIQNHIVTNPLGILGTEFQWPLPRQYSLPIDCCPLELQYGALTRKSVLHPLHERVANVQKQVAPHFERLNIDIAEFVAKQTEKNGWKFKGVMRPYIDDEHTIDKLFAARYVPLPDEDDEEFDRRAFLLGPTHNVWGQKVDQPTTLDYEYSTKR
jgi:hypothetical protein